MGFIMKGLLIVIVFIISASGAARAGGLMPTGDKIFKKMLRCDMLLDTVPAVSKAPVAEKDRPVAGKIKTLPVPRRQAIPVPVKVKVAPVKIIAPKIVKPIIKLLP